MKIKTTTTKKQRVCYIIDTAVCMCGMNYPILLSCCYNTRQQSCLCCVKQGATYTHIHNFVLSNVLIVTLYSPIYTQQSVVVHHV